MSGDNKTRAIATETGSAADSWVQPPKVPLGLPGNPIKRHVKIFIGTLMARLMPKRLQRLHTEARYAGLGLIDQWMLAATAYKAQQTGDQNFTSHILQKFWESDEAAHWMQGNSRYHEMFLPYHSRVVAPLLQTALSNNCFKLFEIGCGRGDVLRHLAAAMPSLQALTGLDLNQKLLDEAAGHTRDVRITYQVGDARLELQSLLEPGSIVVTCGGVYEYWSQQQLLDSFRLIAAHPRCVVALVEPLGSDHDLSMQKNSRPYGMEASLSHNYRHLLEVTGFTVSFSDELYTAAQRWQLMVAVSPSHA